MRTKQMIVAGLCLAGLMLAGNAVYAAGQYGPGVTDTEIKIGNTNPPHPTGSTAKSTPPILT